jgi:hypothetical protein
MDIELTTGPYGPMMIVMQCWSNEVLEISKSNQVVDIALNGAKGWRDTDLEFLQEVPELLGLRIIEANSLLKSVEGIHALAKLRLLYLTCNVEKPIHLDSFPSLEELSVNWHRHIGGWENLVNLRSLHLQECGWHDFLKLQASVQLGKLSCFDSRIKQLTGLSNFKHLTRLSLAILRLEDVSELFSVRSLKDLSLYSCKGFSDLEQFAKLENLEVLTINGLGPIPSLHPLLTLPKLRMLVFGEGTKIMDGDLACLEQMPSLEGVRFTPMRHYNRKLGDFPMGEF